MKSLITTALALTGLLAFTSIEPPQLPPGHPTTNPQLPAGHPAPTPPLPAGHPSVPQPGQLEPKGEGSADHATIEGVVNAYYECISGPNGQPRNWDRFRQLFIPGAKLVSVRAASSSPNIISPAIMTVEQYIKLNSRYFEKGGYFETSVNERRQQFGGLAQVFSTYTSRRDGSAEPYAQGVNGFQLVFDGQRWWINSLAWQGESPGGAPIPAEYLPATTP